MPGNDDSDQNFFVAIELTEYAGQRGRDAELIEIFRDVARECYAQRVHHDRMVIKHVASTKEEGQEYLQLGGCDVGCMIAAFDKVAEATEFSDKLEHALGCKGYRDTATHLLTLVQK